MYSHKFKKPILALAICAISSSCLMAPNSFASAGYSDYAPSEIIANESLYETAKAIEITEEEKNNLSEIDFNRFTDLRQITLCKIFMDDGSLIDLESPIERLWITNSVVDISTFDTSDFDTIIIGNSYNMGEKSDDQELRYEDFLNEEYHHTWDDYMDTIDEITAEIYRESDGASQEVIRLATLYVVEHISYNDNPAGSSTSESVLKYGEGVCVHYATFENILLNKLGIFSLTMISKSDTGGTSHAYNVIYTDGNWYQIDTTWLDHAANIEALRNVGFGSTPSLDDDIRTPTAFELWSEDPLRWYMAELDNEFFNSYALHTPQFTLFDSIPVANRVSKMSILSSLIEDEEPQNGDSQNNGPQEEKNENSMAENESAKEKGSRPESPETGTNSIIKGISIRTANELAVAVSVGSIVSIFTFTKLRKHFARKN